MKNNIIRSPFQFSGNKKKAIQNGLIDLLEQSGKNNLADMMCGSGVVGLNWHRGKVLLNDSHPTIASLHWWLKTTDRSIIDFALGIYEKDFDFTNENDYYSMRKAYNEERSDALLLILIQIGFNSLFRFNQKGEWNVPFGHNKKTYDRNRIADSLEHYGKVDLLHNRSIFEFEYNDLSDYVLYFDPPYYQSKYTYGATWDEDTDEKFWNLIIKLSKTHKVAVSNVLRYRGVANKLLIDRCVEAGLLVNAIGNVKYNNWQKAVSTVDHDVRTTEVLITNFIGEQLPPF